mmetsp:Transcript_39001/g.94306  ORF Transcript_39001/g.94306 Transcript_39001/m.94306 type:complete len:96 (+) Transcript_39001:833-1120(+)
MFDSNCVVYGLYDMLHPETHPVNHSFVQITLQAVSNPPISSRCTGITQQEPLETETKQSLFMLDSLNLPYRLKARLGWTEVGGMSVAGRSQLEFF